MFCSLNFYFSVLCLESVRANFPSSPEHVWNARMTPSKVPFKGEVEMVPGAFKYLHWAFLNDSEIYSLTSPHYTGCLGD